MKDHFPAVKIITIELPFDGTRLQYDSLLEAFFKDRPDIHHCITLGSKAHVMGDFLLRTSRRETQMWATTW